MEIYIEDEVLDITPYLSNDFLKGEKGDKGDTYTITSSDYQAIANVVESDIQSTLDVKVDKVIGKGLSTNDFTDAYKSNVDSNTYARHIHSNKTVLDEISSTDISNWNSKAEVSDITSAVGTETTARQNADNNLQGQIDAITSSSDVVDVVSTYTELQNYYTTKLTADDVIKVMQDSTHSNALSYYRWTITNNVGTWVYVGSEGPFYTKGETDTLLSAKQDTIDSSHKLSSDLVDDTNKTNKFVTTSDKTNWNGKLDSSKVKASNSSTSGDVYDVTYINTMIGDIESLLAEV